MKSELKKLTTEYNTLKDSTTKDSKIKLENIITKIVYKQVIDMLNLINAYGANETYKNIVRKRYIDKIKEYENKLKHTTTRKYLETCLSIYERGLKALK